MEVRPMGIQVCVVEPGDHRGGSQHTRLHATGGAAENAYEPACRVACDIIHRDESNGLLPVQLGRKVVRNVNRRRMRFRLRVAKPDQRLAVVLHDVLNPGLNFRILSDYYGKGGKA